MSAKFHHPTVLLVNLLRLTKPKKKIKERGRLPTQPYFYLQTFVNAGVKWKCNIKRFGCFVPKFSKLFIYF
jgi:hypothetical protein